MLSPTARQSLRKIAVEPVNERPANSGLAIAVSETVCPDPFTTLITPGGRPASSRTRMLTALLSADFSEGFQTTVLPIRAGVEGRFTPMAVKLNGVSARTKPSSGRWSMMLRSSGRDLGWSA